MVKTCDQRSYDLAEHFVGSGPKGSEAERRCNRLALHIQEEIELWMDLNPWPPLGD